MAKLIKHEDITNTIALSQCNDGYWLYDETRGMNLSMKAASERQAFTEALEYYQNRLKEVEDELKVIKTCVQSFVNSAGKLEITCED